MLTAPFREDLLEIPFRNDLHRILRFESGLVLDPPLRRLSRVSGAVDRWLALGLRRLRSGRGYLRLGYARFADYSRERLGIAVRTAHELALLGDGLHRLPVLDRALRAGRLTWSAAAQVARVAGAEDETRWVKLAEELPVRKLRKCVGEALQGRDAAAAGSEGGSSGGQVADARTEARDAAQDVGGNSGVVATADGALAVPGSGPTRSEATTAGDGDGAPARNETEDGPEACNGATRDADDDEVHPVRLSLDAPRGTVLMWEASLDLCGIVAGGELAPGEGPEYVLAELLSALDAAPDSQPAPWQQPPVKWPSPRSPRGSRWPWGKAHCAPEGPAPELGERRPRLSPGTEALLERIDRPVPDDPFEIDAGMRELVRARGSLEVDLARLLRNFHSLSLHLHLGFPSFRAYVAERLGISPGRAHRLVRLDHKLFYFTEVAQAMRDGRIGSVAAFEIFRAATEGETESAWIERAERTTVVRLREEAAWAERKRRVAGWWYDGLPPPPGRLPSALDEITAQIERQTFARSGGGELEGSHVPEGERSGGGHDHACGRDDGVRAGVGARGEVGGGVAAGVAAGAGAGPDAAVAAIPIAGPRTVPGCEGQQTEGASVQTDDSKDAPQAADGLERLRRALQAWAASCGDPAPERRQTFAHPAEPGATSTSPSSASTAASIAGPTAGPAGETTRETTHDTTRDATHEAAREVLLALARDHDAGGFERIEFTLDEAALELWTEARARIEAATGNPAVTDRDVLLLAAVEFLLTHLPVWLEEVATGDSIAVRERFRCAIPGCTVRGGAGHHLRYRSQGGPDEPWNLLFVCYEHHIAGIHRHHVRGCRGAPRTGCASSWECVRGTRRSRSS